MATSSFFYGGSTAPEQNTVDELIDALNQKVSAADQDRVAAEQARDRAETAATNAELSESNVAGLAQQAQETLADAQEAVVAANAAVTTTNTNAGIASTKATEAAASAAAALASQNAAASSASSATSSQTAAASSASAASASQSAAATSATNAASSASAAAGSATTATTQATNASNSATAAAGSASAASTSATNAASSASSAGTSATSAASSASSASTSATSASGSASTATTKASEASASATAAATSATNAAASATSASGSASTATAQATNAANSATAAASSASSASTSATNAANSATAAATSATNAANSATAASGSATAAASSATAAQAAKTAAEAAYDSFDDRYLGAKTSAPTVDNDGNALLTGALYFNSTANQMYAWSGSTWVAAGSTGSGDVVGPASSTDNAIARFDGTTGKLVQNSTATISDTGDAVFKSVGFNDPVHGSRTLSMSSGRLVVDGDFDTVGTYRFGNGWCYLTGGNADGVTLAQLSNGTGNFVLQPNSTGIVETRSGTNPTTFRVYNTYTDASNYERGFARWSSGKFQIGTEKAGAGQTRDIEFVYGGSVVGSIYNSYGNIFEFYGTFQGSRIVGAGPGNVSFFGYQAAAGLNGAFVADSALYGWGSTGNPNNGVDTALARDAAGVVKVTNGSTGLGSLKASTLDVNGSSVTSTTIGNWNTAFGWGNHASAGYLTGITSGQVTTALGYTPPQPGGTGATGTWGISISGNAATATSATSASSATNATNVTGTTTASIQTSALASGTANTTTFLRGDRTWATVSATPTTTDVLNATAGASVGAVGTYAFLGESAAVSTAIGATRAGSGLRYVGIRSSSNWTNTVSGTSANGSTTAPAGTWRAMGTSPYFTDTDGFNWFPATLWLRIS